MPALKPLPPEVIEKFTGWLKTKTAGREHTCPVCGVSRWIIQQKMLAAPVVSTGGIGLAEWMPLLGVYCANCSHVQLFSARLAGINPVDLGFGVEIERDQENGNQG